MPDPSKFYTVAEAADILRKTPATVWLMCRDDKIPATKPGGQWLIPVAEFDAWIKSGANKAMSA